MTLLTALRLSACVASSTGSLGRNMPRAHKKDYYLNDERPHPSYADVQIMLSKDTEGEDGMIKG